MDCRKVILETDDHARAVRYARFVAKQTECEIAVRRSGEKWRSRDVWLVRASADVARHFYKGQVLTKEVEEPSPWGVGWVQCTRCHGSGELEDLSGPYDCPDCSGSGSVDLTELADDDEVL